MILDQTYGEHKIEFNQNSDTHVIGELYLIWCLLVHKCFIMRQKRSFAIFCRWSACNKFNQSNLVCFI